MIHQQLKDLFTSSVEQIASDISQYTVCADTDFLRTRKISPQKLISFLVSQGSSSTKVEMLDFWPGYCNTLFLGTEPTTGQA